MSPSTARIQPNFAPAPPGGAASPMGAPATVPPAALAGAPRMAPDVLVIGDNARKLGNTLRGAHQVQQDLNALLGKSAPSDMLRASQAATASIVPFTDAAGALTDVARSQQRAIADFVELQRVLSDPSAPSALRLAATARATQSASDFIRKQDALMKSLDAADAALLAKHPTYAKLTQDTRQMKAVQAIGRMSTTTMSRLMKAAEVGGSAAGLTLSAIAFPKLVGAVGTSYQNLADAFRNEHATESERLGAVSDLGRATASTIQAAEGMRVSVMTLGRVASESRLIGSAVTQVASTRLIRFSTTALGKAMGVLMPIADVGMFAANGVKAWQTLKDPTAGLGAKARSVLAFGMDGLKLATYLLPMTQGLRMAYLGASIVSLGLATWDFGHAVLPAAKQVGSAFIEAVMEPKATFKKVANAASEGVMTVARGVATVAAHAWDAVTHPVQTATQLRAKADGLVAGGREVAQTLGSAVRLVDRKAGEGIMTIRRTFGGASSTSGLPVMNPPVQASL